MKKTLDILIPIVVCFLVGLTASYFQSASIESWYPLLNKSDITPPNIAFPIVWSILYLFMGVSIGLIINKENVNKKFFIRLFILQLFFNFIWSIVFFAMQNILLGLINIVILDILVIYYALASYKVKKWSSVLFWPYILWLMLATYLNLYIVIYN